jgi:hypothetical protein
VRGELKHLVTRLVTLFLKVRVVHLKMEAEIENDDVVIRAFLNELVSLLEGKITAACRQDLKTAGKNINVCLVIVCLH